MSSNCSIRAIYTAPIRDPRLGTRDPGLGTLDPGLGTLDPGLGTLDPGLFNISKLTRREPYPGHAVTPGRRPLRSRSGTVPPRARTESSPVASPTLLAQAGPGLHRTAHQHSCLHPRSRRHLQPGARGGGRLLLPSEEGERTCAGLSLPWFCRWSGLKARPVLPASCRAG